MNNRRTAFSPDGPPPRGSGYLYFVGVLQIGTGILSILFSVLGLIHASSADAAGLLNPHAVEHLFAGHGSEGWNSLVAGLVSLHITYGWILGLLLITAGICCIRRRARRFVWTSTLLNLVNFPHGTTAALMTWHGLTRNRISSAFARNES
ncbi:hypothetical protein [Haloferula sp. A504]|uniref:hypothetical protein n=1 Tax=Haloferula sp. A504 TaxID=3373601 RepID=UPI0031BE72CB|nr:hypothetical protein [Verrucomicrobiaceae bacterium E54]